MEGQLGGNQQCLKCSHEEEVVSPEAGNKPLLPKIYHCPECHKDYDNAHAYSGHFNIHNRERMNLVLSSMTPKKRKEQAANLKSGKVKVMEQECSMRTPTKDEASGSRDTSYNQPRPELPTSSPTRGSISQSSGNQMHSGNVGNPTWDSPNRSPDTFVHPMNTGNTSHGSINRYMEAVPMPSRNVGNHLAVRHNPLQGSQSGRVGWGQPIIPMSRGPVQAQFGCVGWPRPSGIGSHVSQLPLQDNQSDYLRWARVPLQAGSQSGQVGRGRPLVNSTHGLAQGSQFGHVQRGRPFGQPMSYGPSGGSRSRHLELPNHMNGPSPGSQSGWQRPFRNGNLMVHGPLQGSHQNGSVGWPRPTQIGNPVLNGPSQGSLQYSQVGWAGHSNPVYVDCNITTTVRITGSDVPSGVRIGLNTDPENLSTRENITSTEGGTCTGHRPPEGGHEGEMKSKEEEEELDLTLRL
ncbi:hypothetical protein FRX31_023147 [Thalictrum thalictroides]|uniref:C2H2-type domain-containing protein n=1 Tax=Thalictrum thalictroides TaxID=46969 RepID=A0A7J6VQA7_THATH|nr:hypothetical protein FRX31_023147 [Thalictrum thalictroides]